MQQEVMKLVKKMGTRDWFVEHSFPSMADRASEVPLSQTHYYSIEYPGYVQLASISTAILTLGGQSQIDSVFRRNALGGQVLLELSLRPNSIFAHPIPGDAIATNNLILKVIKRRKKSQLGKTQHCILGEYQAEIVGMISKTVRFRSIGVPLNMQDGI